MPLDITLAGSATATPHIEGTVSLSSSTTSISTATLRVREAKGTPASGSEVGLYEGAPRRFGGVINQVGAARVGGPGGAGTFDTMYDVIAQGWEVRLSMRIIQARVYKDLNAGDIVRDLMATELVGEGFNEGVIEDGLDAVDLGKIVFLGISVAQAISDLANRCGFNSWITPDKDLHFRKKSTTTAGPLVLNAANQNYNMPRITQTGEDYANVVKIKIGWDQVGATRAMFMGDGAATTFDLPDVGGDEQLVDHVAGIFLNSVPQTVGVLGVDTNSNWFYEVGEKTITQNTLDPVLSGADQLDVDYYVLGRNIIVEEDAGEIAARVTIEGGGSGKYEIFVDDSGNSDQVGAQTKAQSLLDRLAPGRNGGEAGSWPKVYEFQSFSYYANSQELYPGNIITVDWTCPDSGGAKQVMVQSVDSSEVAGLDPDGGRGYLAHKVKAVEHIAVGDHRAFLRALGGDNGSGASLASGGGSVDKYERFVFNVGIPAVGKKTPIVTAQRPLVRLTGWCITVVEAPTGAGIRVDVLRNGTSILPSATASKIVLAAGGLKARGTEFLTSPMDIVYDDDITIDIQLVGSTFSGSDMAITLIGMVV